MKPRQGALAEYARLPVDQLTLGPRHVIAVDAAGFTLAGFMSYQPLCHVAKLEGHQTIRMHTCSTSADDKVQRHLRCSRIVGPIPLHVKRSLPCAKWHIRLHWSIAQDCVYVTDLEPLQNCRRTYHSLVAKKRKP